MPNSTITHACSKHTQYTIFLLRHFTAFSHLGALQHFSTMLEDHFKEDIHQQKAQNLEKMALNRLTITLFYCLRVESRRSVILFDLSWEHVHGAPQIVCDSLYSCEWL